MFSIDSHLKELSALLECPSLKDNTEAQQRAPDPSARSGNPGTLHEI